MTRIRHHLGLPLVARNVKRLGEFAMDVEHTCELRTSTGTYVLWFPIGKDTTDEEMVAMCRDALSGHVYEGNRIVVRTALPTGKRANRPSGRW